MNQDYMLFAEKIKDVGEKLNEISNNLKFMDTRAKMSVEEIREIYLGSLDAIDNYNKCKSDLLKMNMNQPKKVDKEFTELCHYTQMLIDGTELMTEGIDINTAVINQMMIIRGAVLQKVGAKETNIAVDKIVDKLIKK